MMKITSARELIVETFKKEQCYKCRDTNKTMLSVHAPGTYYICTDCIEKEEKLTGKIGIFFYMGGLKFMDKESYRELNKEN